MTAHSTTQKTARLPHKTRLLVGGTIGALLLTMASHQDLWAEDAQGATKEKTTALEAITVTANKIEENMADIPQSLTVLDKMSIQQRNINNTDDLYSTAPNLLLNKMGPVSSFATLRGITSSMTAENPAVGYFVDGVYHPEIDMTLLDIERVEIMRGPQGTLYGRNTLAGAINIITKKPEGKTAASIALGYGQFNERYINTVINGTFIPGKLYSRFSGQYQASDGYFTSTNGSKDIDKSEKLDTKAGFYLSANNSLDFDLSLDLQRYRGNYAEFATLGQFHRDPHVITSNYGGKADKDALGISLKADYLMQGMRLVSVTDARTENKYTSMDNDFTQADVAIFDMNRKSNIVSQELRLSSDNTSKFKWLGGAYFFYEEVDRLAGTNFKPYSFYLSQRGKTNTLGTSAFMQADYAVTDKLAITGGIRYDRESKDFKYSHKGGSSFSFPDTSGSADKDFTAWLPKASISYKLTSTCMPYLTVSKGFRSGGFNLYNKSPGESYNSEFTWNYEAGIKSFWFDKRLELNLAGFIIKWQDIQLEVPGGAHTTPVIQNAGRATSKGFELEARAKLNESLRLFGGFGYTSATFDSYQNLSTSYNGNYVPNVPKYTFTIGGTYKFLENFVTNVEYNGVGKTYYNADNSQSQAFYSVFNVKVGYEKPHYSINVWAKNLLDKNYLTRAFEDSGVWYGRAGSPRTFGIDFKYTF